MSQEKDKIFFRNFSLAIAFISVMMVVFFAVAQFVATDEEVDAKKRAATIAEITAPVGKVATVGEEVMEKTAADVSPGDSDGKTIYDGLCVNCHGIAALASVIPQTGDTAVWEVRIAKGIDVLYDNAINGFTGNMGMMPGRGGDMKLTDDQVKAAVDYIIKQAQ